MYAEPGAAYPISVHVYGLHLRGNWEWGPSLLTDVVSNGRKLELGCPSAIPKKEGIPLSLGDFRARILKGTSGLEFGDLYELLLPDNRVMRCSVSGLME